jgi:hypothetical protein
VRHCVELGIKRKQGTRPFQAVASQFQFVHRMHYKTSLIISFIVSFIHITHIEHSTIYKNCEYGDITILDVELGAGTMRRFREPPVEIGIFTDFKEESIVAVIQIGKFVQHI